MQGARPVGDFREEWFSQDACDVIAELVARADRLQGRIVEVGCWEGRSTIAIANACFPSLVEAVDTWHGSPGEISAELAQERDVLGQFLANIAADTQGNVTVVQKDWRDHFAQERSPIRFCHIDATHSYEEVRDNTAAALALIVDGGILCGDDAHHEPVRRAALEVLGPSVNVSGPVWWYTHGEADLADRYRDACATPSDIYEHLPTFVSLVEDLKAKTVIELGTRGGVSTVAWLYGLEKTDGHLWSVDVDPAPELQHPRWTFIQGDDLSVDTINRLPEEVDIVFIDTSHEYQQTVAELNVYRWMVRPGGKIVLHDTELAHPLGVPVQPRFPVKTAVEEFCFEEGLSWTNTPGCFGLGVIDIPEES